MKQIIRSFVAVGLFIVLLGFGYTLIVTGIAGVVWPDQAAGSLVKKDGAVIGSKLLAQPFEGERLFLAAAVGLGLQRRPGP